MVRQGDEDDGKPTRQFILLSRTPDPKHHRVSMSEVDQRKSVHAGTQLQGQREDATLENQEGKQDENMCSRQGRQTRRMQAHALQGQRGRQAQRIEP